MGSTVGGFFCGRPELNPLVFCVTALSRTHVGGLEPVGLQSVTSSCWVDVGIRGISGSFWMVAVSSLNTRATSVHSATTKINTPMTGKCIWGGRECACTIGEDFPKASHRILYESTMSNSSVMNPQKECFSGACAIQKLHISRPMNAIIVPTPHGDHNLKLYQPQKWHSSSAITVSPLFLPWPALLFP